MKKLVIFVISLVLLFSLCSCKTDGGLTPFVSELRSDVFVGEGQSLSLKAGYGFKETPFITDGKTSNKTYALTFKLLGVNDQNVAYSLTANLNGRDYNANFTFNPVSHSLTTIVEIEDFKEKEFAVTVRSANTVEQITLKSILPENTIDYKSALSHVKSSQSALVKSYTDTDGNLTAELHVRVLVKDGHPYWYVGFAKDNDLKALLVDGLSGEILAVREIF